MEYDPDIHLDDRPAGEQLADRASEARERFTAEGLRDLEEVRCAVCGDQGVIPVAGPDENGMYDTDDCPACQTYPNGHFCHRLPECRGRSSCPREIACTH